MSVCRCMILAFAEGWENDSYGRYDLECGIDYATDLLEDRRRRYDPMYRYDLRKFLAWAKAKLLALDKGEAR